MGLLTAQTVKNEFQKSKMADGRHFENRYIAISPQPLTDFYEIWHADAEPISSLDRPLKIQN